MIFDESTSSKSQLASKAPPTTQCKAPPQPSPYGFTPSVMEMQSPSGDFHDTSSRARMEEGDDRSLLLSTKMERLLESYYEMKSAGRGFHPCHRSWWKANSGLMVSMALVVAALIASGIASGNLRDAQLKLDQSEKLLEDADDLIDRLESTQNTIIALLGSSQIIDLQAAQQLTLTSVRNAVQAKNDTEAVLLELQSSIQLLQNITANATSSLQALSQEKEQSLNSLGGKLEASTVGREAQLNASADARLVQLMAVSTEQETALNASAALHKSTLESEAASGTNAVETAALLAQAQLNASVVLLEAFATANVTSAATGFAETVQKEKLAVSALFRNLSAVEERLDVVIGGPVPLQANGTVVIDVPAEFATIREAWVAVLRICTEAKYVIQLAAGTHDYTGQVAGNLSLSAIPCSRQVTIRGHNDGSVIAADATWELNGTDGLTIEDVTLETSGTRSIWVESTKGITLRNITSLLGSQAVFFHNGAQGVVEDSTFRTSSGDAIGAYFACMVKVQRTTVMKTGGVGSVAVTAFYSSTIYIVDCNITGYLFGVMAEHSSVVVVDGTTNIQVGSTGLYVVEASSGTISSDSSISAPTYTLLAGYNSFARNFGASTTGGGSPASVHSSCIYGQNCSS